MISKLTDAPKLNKQIPFLDGIRGLAALWVLAGHTSNRCGTGLRFHENAAVDIFMIMSGFLMTEHYFSRKATEPWDSITTWINFYVRRFFRIAPLYYFVLIPSFFWFTALAQANKILNQTTGHTAFDPTNQAVNLSNIALHVSFLFGLFPGYCYSLMLPDWSIGLEMQFYLLFPLMMLAARWMQLLPFATLVALCWFTACQLISVYATSPPGMLGHFPMPSFLPLKLGLFLIGMLTAWIWADSVILSKRSVLIIAVAIALAASVNLVVLAATLLLNFMLFSDKYLVIPGVQPTRNIVNSVLANRLTHFMAEMSYGVYLTHVPLLIALMTVLPMHGQYSAFVRFCVVAPLVIASSYATAWLLHRLVEKPGIDFGRRISRRLLDRQAKVLMPSHAIR